MGLQADFLRDAAGDMMAFQTVSWLITCQEKTDLAELKESFLQSAREFKRIRCIQIEWLDLFIDKKEISEAVRARVKGGLGGCSLAGLGLLATPAAPVGFVTLAATGAASLLHAVGDTIFDHAKWKYDLNQISKVSLLPAAAFQLSILKLHQLSDEVTDFPRQDIEANAVAMSAPGNAVQAWDAWDAFTNGPPSTKRARELREKFDESIKYADRYIMMVLPEDRDATCL